MQTSAHPGFASAMLCAAAFAMLLGPLAARADDARAASNYRLNCAGCHLEDGTGKSGLVPGLAGTLGKVFSLPGGREFIGRIPGVANSFLTDEELSELLNWSLRRFDAKHLPSDFKPYSPEEVGYLRKDPLSDTIGARAVLMQGTRLPARPTLDMPRSKVASSAVEAPGVSEARGFVPDSTQTLLIAYIQTGQ